MPVSTSGPVESALRGRAVDAVGGGDGQEEMDAGLALVTTAEVDGGLHQRCNLFINRLGACETPCELHYEQDEGCCVRAALRGRRKSTARSGDEIPTRLETFQVIIDTRAMPE